MKKLIHLFIFTVLMQSAHSQSLKRDYYDPWTKSILMAEYQVNSTGEKHGWFKGYDQKGVLVFEYNYKNNEWHGINKEYTTVWGNREITKSETYEAGILHGPATYYGKGDLVLREGRYQNGERDGKWFETAIYVNYDIDEELKKGCDHITMNVLYDKGKRREEAHMGEVREFFYPSKKLRSIINHQNGKRVGKAIWYYPNGSVETQEEYDASGGIMYTHTLYPNGKTKSLTGMQNGKEVFEQFDSRGNPTRNMENWVLNREKNIRERQLLLKGDSCLSVKDLKGAVTFYKASGDAVYSMYGNQNPIGFQKQRAIEKCVETKSLWAEHKRVDLVFRKFDGFKKNMNPDIGKELELMLETTLKGILLESVAIDPDLTIATIKDNMRTSILSEAVMVELLAQIEGEMKRQKEEKELNEMVAKAMASYGGSYSSKKMKVLALARPILDRYFAEYKLADGHQELISTANQINMMVSRMVGLEEDNCKDYLKQLKGVTEEADIKRILEI
jgi:antitoxin component YwqK of YwqJK toxin-antitoxin module